MKLAGLLLIIVGVLALVYQTFTYTKTEKDVQLGPVQIEHNEKHTVEIPTIVGGVLVAAGVAAVVLGARSKY